MTDPQLESTDNELEMLNDLAESFGSEAVTVQERVTLTLRTAILRGLLPPGTKLRQEAIAQVFNTSRIPIREALMALEYEGLASSEPHRGFTVTALDGEEIAEVYEIRIALESHALRLAIPLLTESDLEDIRVLYEMMENTDDPDAQLAARERFYHRLYVVTSSPRLVQLIFRFRQEVARSLRWQLVKHSPSHHRTLYEAVRDGDVDLAVAELTSHYRKISALIRRYLREPNQQPSNEYPPQV